MEPLSKIARQLKQGHYPIRGLGINPQGWIEAEFRHKGITVTLALPQERASAVEFADLFDKAVSGGEAE